MNLSIVTPNGFLKYLWPELYNLGHDLLINGASPACDRIICFSITQMDGLEQAHKLFPNIPIINYNWDLYEWHLKNPRPDEHDWQRYKKLLGLGKVLVPSEVTKKRTKELFGLDSEVVKTFATLYDYPVKDNDYVLLPWRKMPDECYGWAKRACEDLGIPYKEPNKNLNWEDWKKVVAECSFIVSDHKEASTGSLAIIEAAYLGKFTICNGSEYSAAREYLNGAGWYFNAYDELKACIKEAWERRPIGDSDKKWLKKEYLPATMAKRIHENLYNR